MGMVSSCGVDYRHGNLSAIPTCDWKDHGTSSGVQWFCLCSHSICPENRFYMVPALHGEKPVGTCGVVNGILLFLLYQTMPLVGTAGQPASSGEQKMIT